MNKSWIHGYRWHRCTGVLPKDVQFHHWTLGFRQFSFSHIVQALQDGNIHVFCYSPLYRHALVPLLFQVKVSCSPWSQLLCCIPRAYGTRAFRKVRARGESSLLDGSTPLSSIPMSVMIRIKYSELIKQPLLFYKSTKDFVGNQFCNLLICEQVPHLNTSKNQPRDCS